MQYTMDSLRALMDSPIDHNKWGGDTHRIISILKIIFGAGCSSCMFRRKVAELRKLLEKHGDTIAKTDNYIEIKDSSSNRIDRIPCPDCVAKHISEAYVLQCEFYQGYTDYIELLKTHLQEAISECPKDNLVVLNILNTCLRSVAIDGKPKIPLVLTISELNLDNVAKDTDNVKCSLYRIADLLNILSAVPDTELSALHRFVSGIPVYTSMSSMDEKFDWYGRLALISDIVSKYSQLLGSEIRRRRLKYYNNPVDTDMSIMQCVDVLSAVNVEISNRGNLR